MNAETFQSSGTMVYVRIFDYFEEVHVGVTLSPTKIVVILKLSLGAPKLYIFMISVVLVCYVHCHLNFSLLVTKL